MLGKEGPGASGHVTGESPVLVGTGYVLPQVLLLAVETTAALVWAAQAPTVVTMRIGVNFQVPLGEERPPAGGTLKLSLVVHFSVLAQESPLGEDLSTAFHITCVASVCTLMSL